MAETYKGLPVVGESVVLEVDDAGRYTGQISGQLLEEIENDVPSIDPKLSKHDALSIALKSTKHNLGDIQFNPERDAQLQIHVSGKEDVKAHLVYGLNYRIETRYLTTRPTFIIDANDGKVIKTWDALSMAGWRKRQKRTVNEVIKYKLVEGDGGNKKIGKHVYGLDLPELRVQTLDNGTCVLENQYAIVYNCNFTYSCVIENLKPHHFDCEKGNDDMVNGAYSPLNDALFYVGITYEMYADWYEISDPLKTQELNGGRCITRAHYGEAYENAFWDGDYITFGDGADTMYPLTSINVVAHEVSHGFTEKNSGLIYSGESGGMNEAFSDMAGEAAEDYLMHKIDWMVGFSIWKPENESMRYFDDPTRDGKSIGNADDMCFMMNPHRSSGVYNRVFYLLSNTPGWCVRKAFHVFVVANDMYWRPDSGFNDGACDALRAAKDLGYSQEDVRAAFQAAGVEPCSTKVRGGLDNMLQMKNDSTLTFEIAHDHDLDLEYSHLLVYAASENGIELTVKTPFHKYSVVPAERGAYASNINVGRECYMQNNCTIVIHAPAETYALVLPMFFLTPIVRGIDLSANDTIYQNETSSNSTSDFNIVFAVEFSLPKVVVEKRMNTMFLASAIRGYGNYFIRHGQPPNIESREFDVVGSVDPRGRVESPAWLCKPQNGTYYLWVSLYSESMIDLRIELVVASPTKQVEEEEETSPENTPTPSLLERREEYMFDWK